MGKRALGAGLAAVLAVLVVVACSSDKTKPRDVAACHDIATITHLLNSSGDDLAASKKLFTDIKNAIGNLVADAPGALKADARALEKSINVAKPFVDRAKSLDTLHQLEQSSVVFQGALNDLATYGSNVGNWRSANCKG